MSSTARRASPIRTHRSSAMQSSAARLWSSRSTSGIWYLRAKAAPRSIAMKSIIGFPFWIRADRIHLGCDGPRCTKATADSGRRSASLSTQSVDFGAQSGAAKNCSCAHAAALAGTIGEVLYGTQTRTSPPTFALFINRPGALKESYKKYLIHQLREELGLEHAPIRLDLRARREERSGR